MPNSNQSTQPTPPPLRQCGRCRLFFPAPSDLSRAELAGWWLCNGCTARLTPSRATTPDDDAPTSPDDPE